MEQVLPVYLFGNSKTRPAEHFEIVTLSHCQQEIQVGTVWGPLVGRTKFSAATVQVTRLIRVYPQWWWWCPPPPIFSKSPSYKAMRYITRKPKNTPICCKTKQSLGLAADSAFLFISGIWVERTGYIMEGFSCSLSAPLAQLTISFTIICLLDLVSSVSYNHLMQSQRFGNLSIIRCLNISLLITKFIAMQNHDKNFNYQIEPWSSNNYE